jgi:glycosyltransferase involved in cell wall biosynthesis
MPDAPAHGFAGLRVAIVHDWIQGYHGSERAVDALVHDVFGDADAVDVFSFSAVPELVPRELAAHIRGSSRLAALPGLRQRGHDPGRWRWLLPYMPGWFRRLDLRGYDVVVASSHACALHARPPAGAVHVCYCYTPMRYAWLPAVDRRRLRGPERLIVGALGGWLRRGDRRAAARVRSFVAISDAVRDRIAEFYGREAAVIAPPVDTAAFSPRRGTRSGDVLWVHRMVPYKRPELVLETFRDTQHRVTMVGVGPLHDRIAAAAPANVEVRGWVDREELVGLFESAGAFLHLGEEDFGISMVEALAAGTPVIALDRGGARDIVRDGIDGVLLSDTSPATVRAAVDGVMARSWDRDALAARASQFSRAVFAGAFAAHVRGLADRPHSTPTTPFATSSASSASTASASARAPSRRKSGDSGAS